jgi:hypothetical protein
MSRDELRDLAYDLQACGAISWPDLRLLTFDPVTSAPHWPNWNAFETPVDAEGRRDWIAEMRARIRKGYPERAYIGYLELLLSFLERVDAARQALSRPAEPAADAATTPVPVPTRAAAPVARPVPAGFISPVPRPAST